MTTFTAMPKYDSYKSSGYEWIGDIPTSWDLTKLGACLTPVSTKNRADLPLLSITRELGVIERDTEDQDSNHNFIPDDLSGYKVIEAGQFGMNKMKAWQGSYGVSKYTGIVSPAYYVFKFEQDIDPDFFHWAIRSHLYISFFASASDGVRVGQWDLSKGRMKEIPFVFPEKKIQTAIANFLDEKTVKIDEAIAIKEKQIELLKERKQIIIQQAVTQGLDPTVPMKDSGVEWIGKIPAHWEVIRLKDICKAYGRIGFRGYTASDLVNAHEGAITLSPSNIIDSEMNYEKCSYLSWEKYFESPEIMIKNTDIILVKTGSSYGKSAIVKSLSHEATINPQLLVIKDILISAFYLHYLMTSVGFLSVIDSEVIGSTIPTISENKIMNIKIAVPGNDEQLKIVEYLDLTLNEVTKGIENIDSQVEKLKEYKTTLINSAVTGKIKVV